MRIFRLFFWMLAGALLAATAAAGASGSTPDCQPLPVIQGTLAGEAGQRRTGPLRVVSVNMHGQGDLDVLWQAVHDKPQLKDADIFILQEFTPSDHELVANASQPAGFHFAYATNPDPQVAAESGQGLGFVSRFPLSKPEVLPLPQYNITFNSRCRIALSARAAAPDGEVAIFNLHLDTRINAGKRVRQFGPAVEAAKASGLPSLIAGDFNSADFLWIGGVAPIPWLQLQKRAIRKNMEKEGFATAFRKTGATFNRFPMKLDWIFHKDLKAVDSGLVKLEFTDHKALWVTLDRMP